MKMKPLSGSNKTNPIKPNFKGKNAEFKVHFVKLRHLRIWGPRMSSAITTEPAAEMRTAPAATSLAFFARG